MTTTAHELSLIGEKLVPWTTDQIGRVVTGGSFVDPGQVRARDGRSCMVGNRFDIDLREDFAFDIDEDVELEVQFYLQGAPRELSISYDGATGRTSAASAHLPEAAGRSPWLTQKWTLHRARFADLGRYGTDLTLGSDGGPTVQICEITVKRSYLTPSPEAQGYVDLQILMPLKSSPPTRPMVIVGLAPRARRGSSYDRV